MAAEELARSGRQVLVCEAKSSMGRKFLMAGKSGLNITKAEDLNAFVFRYDAQDWLGPMLMAFGPDQVIEWAQGLDQPVFTGSTGRVFPVSMKASPLLRAGLRRLADMGVLLRTGWRWAGFDGDGFRFETPVGPKVLHPQVTVLALGGASWARLGSDAAWVPWLVQRGVQIAPFAPANMGFVVNWSPHMARFYGTAVKGAALTVGDQTERGEFVVSARGIEGGGIYSVSRAMRLGAALHVDLMPDLSAEKIAQRFTQMRGKETLTNRLRKLGLAPVAVALVMEFGRGRDPVAAIKSLPIQHQGPRPIDEAISAAGGVMRQSVSEDLQLRAIPRVFVCGEMLDWEAPTGGYLLTACWATGRWAGRAAAAVRDS